MVKQNTQSKEPKMYTVENFKTKKALKEALKAKPTGIPCYQPGLFGPSVEDGRCCCEGPHYPAPHTWYATVVVKGGKIISIK